MSILIKLLVPLIEPILLALYKILKDLAKGNPIDKREKAREEAGKDFDESLDNMRGESKP